MTDIIDVYIHHSKDGPEFSAPGKIGSKRAIYKNSVVTMYEITM